MPGSTCKECWICRLHTAIRPPGLLGTLGWQQGCHAGHAYHHRTQHSAAALGADDHLWRGCSASDRWACSSSRMNITLSGGCASTACMVQCGKTGVLGSLIKVLTWSKVHEHMGKVTRINNSMHSDAQSTESTKTSQMTSLTFQPHKSRSRQPGMGPTSLANRLAALTMVRALESGGSGSSCSSAAPPSPSSSSMSSSMMPPPPCCFSEPACACDKRGVTRRAHYGGLHVRACRLQTCHRSHHHHLILTRLHAAIVALFNEELRLRE